MSSATRGNGGFTPLRALFVPVFPANIGGSRCMVHQGEVVALCGAQHEPGDDWRRGDPLRCA